MADTPESNPTTPDPAKRVEVQLNRSKQQTTFVNAFHTVMNTDELLLELGINIGQLPGGPQNAVTVELSQRIVLNYPTAKRLAGTLAQAIQAYEKRFGEIKTQAELTKD